LAYNYERTEDQELIKLGGLLNKAKELPLKEAKKKITP
jgi:hypothetical protein